MEREASLTNLPIATWGTLARDDKREERERERQRDGHRHRGDPTIGSCLFGKDVMQFRTQPGTDGIVSGNRDTHSDFDS